MRAGKQRFWNSRRNGTWLILLLLTFYCTCARAQESPPDTAIYEYPTRHITVREGLTRNQLKNVSEDSRGFIWLAGKMGVDRFDGLEVVSYRNDSNMVRERVHQFLNDRHGRIWMSGKNTMYWYDGYRFNSIKIPLPIHLSMHEAGDEGIFIVDVKTSALQFIDGGGEDRAPSVSRRARPAMPAGYPLYFTTYSKEKGLNILKSLRLHQTNPVSHLRVGSVRLVAPTDIGSPLLLVDPDSTFSIEGGELIFQQLTPKNISLRGALHAHPKGIIYRYFDRVAQPANPFPQLFNGKDLLHWGSFRNGRFLITGEDGLNIVRPSSAVHLYPPDRGMASDVWTALEVDVEGINTKYFFPFSKGPIVKMVSGKLSEISPPPTINAQRWYPGGLKLANGDFILPNDAVVYHFNASTEVFKPLTPAVHNTANDVYARGDRLFTAGNGLFIFDDLELTDILTDEDGLAMRDLSYLESITPDGENQLWLGSHQGLAVYNLTTNTFRNYLAGQDIPAGICHGAEDLRGNLWFATHDGVAFHDYTDTLPRWVAPDFNEDVKFVHPIDSTWLLIGGTDKLYLLDLPKFYAGEIDIYPYDEDDGFPVAEPLQASVMEDSEGIIWIGTTECVVRLDPARIVLYKKPTEPHFYSFSYQNESTEQDTTILIPFNENGKQSFTIKSTDQNIDVRFFTINHDKPHSMTFRYRLLGYRDSWSRPEATRYVNFGELPPGNYHFELQACLFGECTATKNMELQVRPARFWEYAVVKFGTGTLLVLICGLLCYQFYHKRQMRQQTEKERQDFELERVKTRRKLTVHKIGPHFANNALTAISDLIIRRENEAARRYTSRFARLFRPVLEDSLPLLRPLAEEIDFIEDYLELELLRFERKLRFEIVIFPEIEQVAYEILVPTLLIQSFVNNAVKHGIEPQEIGGILSLTIGPADGDYITVTVADNGPGMSVDQAEEGTGIESARVILEYLNQYTNTNSTFDLKADGSGTTVTLRLFAHHQPID